MRRMSSLRAGSVCALALGLVAGLVDARAQTVDILYFVQHGNVLLSSAWASTFAEPGLQAGPIQIGALALIAKGASQAGISQGVAESVVVQMTSTWLLAFVTGLVLADRPPRARFVAQLAVVVIALATQMIHRAYTDGHPAQIVIPLLWVTAGLTAQRRRSIGAGGLIGLAAGFETWAVLGAPILLLASARREALRGLAALGGVVSLLYLPFVLAGDFRMFDYAWKVVAGAPASLLLEPGSPFPWWMRAIQGGAAVGVGACVAVLTRRSPAGVWAVPLAIAAVRVGLEPSVNDWYFIAVETLGLVAAADLCTGRLATMRARAAAQQDGALVGPLARR
jgi:hypothetical protein